MGIGFSPHPFFSLQNNQIGCTTENRDMKIGVTDSGGGFRDIYGVGVLDYCLDHHISFDLCLAVSAGGANMASFIAGQRGRNLKFYTEYGQRKEYVSLKNFIRTGNYINLDYVYGFLSNDGGEYPLDYDAFEKNPTDLIVVAEEAESGRTRYFKKNDVHRNDYGIFMATASLPGINRPYVRDDIAYFDGALADPVPIDKALSEGCDKIVVLLSWPVLKKRTSGKDRAMAGIIGKKYPMAAENLKKRASRYNAGVLKALELEKEGRALVLAPEETDGVRTLSRDCRALMKLYERGYKDGEKIAKWLG